MVINVVITKLKTINILKCQFVNRQYYIIIINYNIFSSKYILNKTTNYRIMANRKK